MSGLMAARVLHEHFEHVTLLDRDDLPQDAQARRGVPQGNHAHGLLSSGCAALERLFPGLGADLRARGAVDVKMGSELGFFTEGQRIAQADTDMTSLLLSRPLLESYLRERVRSLPNVSILHGREVVELLGSSAAIRGVLVKARNSVDAFELPADLVVDASGRSSRLGEWLERRGLVRAPEERVRIDIGYTSCTYRREPHHAGGLKGLAVAVAPPNRRSAVALAQEGDRWIVTLVGHLGEHAPATHWDMLEFSKHLPTRAVYVLLREAEPLTVPVYMRFPFSQRRHYEQLRTFPEGLLAIGDTLCSFNPSFGQGMSVAALEALQLQSCLQDQAKPLWKRMFRASARIIDTPWTIAVGADLGFPEVEGKRTALGRVLGQYVKQLRRGAIQDPKLALAFLRVAQLLDEPPALLTPSLVFRTLRSSLATPTQPAALQERESIAG
jgi:2-polyprenyl-6-methoxyphenol hydroxylase-like FAD-dependent oxidoreductase